MNKAIFEPIVGLEIHIQLKTARKMFCGCSADIWKAKPNSHVCPVCLGLPGALPVPNQKAIELTQLTGLALNCESAKQSKFDRKNYFYPDLPKGYQVSQYDQPLASQGWLELKIKNEKLKIRIRRVHLEEDTAKSIHEKDATLLDFNKSGIPLMEIVTEPDLRSADEAVEFGKKIQQIARWIGVSDADMEKGQMRLELNISLKKFKIQNAKLKIEIQNSKLGGNDKEENEESLPNYKVEVKNINSFRFLGRIVEYEIQRQTELLEKGEEPEQETRGWNEKGETVSQRFKETEADYRYFPEPDIPPLEFSEEYLKNLKAKLPKLPDVLLEEYQRKFGLSEQVVKHLARSREKVDHFDQLVDLGLEAEKAANLIINKPEVLQQSAQQVASDFKRSAQETIESEEELKKIIQKVIQTNPQPVAEYKAGKETVLQFLVGQVMRETRGKASPQITQKLLKQLLAEYFEPADFRN